MRTIKILHNGKPLEIKQENGRYYVTFTPISPTDKLLIQNSIDSEKICDIKFIQSQLEMGTVMSDYEDNTSTETVLARLLENVKEIAIKTAGENTANEIKLNSEGMVRRYTNTDGSVNYIAETSKGDVSIKQDADYFAETVTGSNLFKSTILDKNTGAFSGMYQSIDRLNQSVKSINEAGYLKSSEFTLTPSQIEQKISSSDGRINSIVSDLNGTTQYLISKDSLARTVASSDVFRREISATQDVFKNLISEVMSGFKADSGQNSSFHLLTDSNGLYAIAPVESMETVTVNFHEPTAITNVTNSMISIGFCAQFKEYYPISQFGFHNISDFPKSFQNKSPIKKYLTFFLPFGVTSEIFNNAKVMVEKGTVASAYSEPLSKNTAIRSSFTQQQNNIGMALFGQNDAISRINLGEKGLYLKGDTIRLDGTTVMDDAFANNIFAKNISATTVEAFTGKFSSVIAQNIDVNSLTGFSATWVQELLIATNSTMRMTGEGIQLQTNSGHAYAEFNKNGLDFKDAYGVVGRMGMINEMETASDKMEGMFIGARPGKHVSLSSYNPSNGTYVRQVTIDGTTGDVSIHGRNMRRLLKILDKLEGRLLSIPISIDSDGTANQWVNFDFRV